MKITKKLLEQYVREVMKEAWQQKIFGGEEEILPPTSPEEPTSPQPEPKKYAPSGAPKTVRHLLNSYIKQHTNDEYFQTLSIGPRQFHRLYMLNSKWREALGMDPESTDIEGLPKITNITKMQSGIIDVDFSDGDVASWQPHGVDVNQMYVRRRRNRWQ